MTRRVESVRASEVHRKRIDWLVPGRIPIGYLSLLIGVQGLGKSQWLTWLAAANSRGSLTGAPAVTLICSAEDAWDSTVRPRLEACEADLTLVRFVEVVYEDGLEDGLLLPDDVSELAREIHDTGATLVTVDPVLAHLGRDIDSHKDASTRQALAPLARVADEHQCAVVAAHHLNKGSSSDPLTRASASVAFTAQARSVLLFTSDPEDPEGERGSQRALAHVKCNLAPLAATQRWQVEPIMLPATNGDPAVETSRVRMTGESSHTGRELLAATNGRHDDEERSAIDEAVAFLETELYDGPKPVKQLTRSARECGISEKTLQRASTRLGVTKSKDGFGGSGGWIWTLEIEPAKDGQGGWPSMVANGVGHLWENPHQQTENTPPQEGENTIGDHAVTVATFEPPEACGTCRGSDLWRAADHQWRCRSCEPPVFPGEVLEVSAA